MKKKNPYRYFVLLAILAVVVFGGYKYYQHQQSQLLEAVNPDDTKPKAFVIEKGESTREIAQKLQDEGLVRSASAFEKLVKDSGKADKIQAGDYKLTPAMSAAEVLDNLESGVVDQWITLLEGWRVEEMANKLNQVLAIDKDAFLKAAKEGYMFPDTYLFNKDATSDTIASTLENTFDTRYSDDLQAKIKAKGLTTSQGVILASIVEREGRSQKVRTEIAGILLKRFKMGMALNADATVQYAKDTASYKKNPKLKFWQPVTQADYKEVESPYNTYLHQGLPPAPICNPSLMSLQAVADADPTTPYIYYYHDSQGNSYYAKTLEEHNRNVANHP